MILSFPSPQSLSLAINSGTIPAEVTTSPCSASIDPSGSMTVEASFRLTKAAKAELASKGIEEVKRHIGAEVDYSCWLQLIPTVAEPGVPAISQLAPVLFELPDEKTLSEFVSEMLRLGNDRQSFRHVAGEDSGTRILLRVIGPPYYTLLRAIERFSDGPSGITAFVERAPRVWVELGQLHPLASKVVLADGQMLLIAAPRNWTFTADASFRNVYEILDFPLPHAPVAYADRGPGDAITIPIRLTAGNTTDVPEFWVLPSEGIDSLDAFVRDADERLLRRLRFAVATTPNGTVQYVLNVAPSKQSPPVLSLPGLVGYKPYWKLPNLFVPVGQRLHPPLRRETVRKLLADDPDQAHWLSPESSGRFVPHTIPFDAFRPLDEWVNYIIERDREPIAAWIAASTFDFDSFVCHDSGPKSGGGGGKGGKATPTAESATGRTEPTVTSKAKPKTPVAKKSDTYASSEPPQSVGTRTPSEWELRRNQLEEQFLGDATGELDSAERTSLWPDLADCYAALNSKDDAAISYAHAIWNQSSETRTLASRWLRAESGLSTLTAEQFDPLLKVEPVAADLRIFAAAVLASLQEPWFGTRREAVQKYLTDNEARMSTRAAWLVASALARQSGADVLGLARARDRILSRLFESGLHPERDMPTFLRFAGLKNSDRARVVREKAHRIYASVRKWVVGGITTKGLSTKIDQVHTPVFVDYVFAYCFARLQDAETTAQILTKISREILPPPNPETEIFRRFAVPIIADGYRYRIDQALAGKSHSGKLPDSFRISFEKLLNTKEPSEVATAEKKPSTSSKPLEFSNLKPPAQMKTGILNPYKHTGYCLTRLFEQSRILEPQERKDPSTFNNISKDWEKKLQSLEYTNSPDQFEQIVRSLLTRKNNPVNEPPIPHFPVLLKAIPFSGRAREPFAIELIEMVPSVIETEKNQPAEVSLKQGQMLERSLLVAAHFDRRDLVTKLVDLFIRLVHEKPEIPKYHLINAFGCAGLITLRKLGMSDVIERMLNQLGDEILKGQSVDQLKANFAKDPKAWSTCLQALLVLAAGWFTFDLIEPAKAILDTAEKEIHPLIASLTEQEIPALIKAYVTALGFAPVDFGLERIERFFEKTDPSRLPNGLTTAPLYSKRHLDVVEAVVLAIVKDDGGQALGGRRWRDEDEYLVRKRIHEDVRRGS
ncbi:MAG: hypothetical protein U0798_11935 [Gemmataceae bacterium]